MNRAFPAVFAAAALLLAAPAAQAFTLQDGGNSSAGKSLKADETSPFYGPKKYDLDTKDSGSGSYKFNGGEFRFGAQPNPDADFRAGLDRMFNPLGRPGQ